MGQHVEVEVEVPAPPHGDRFARRRRAASAKVIPGRKKARRDRSELANIAGDYSRAAEGGGYVRRNSSANLAGVIAFADLVAGLAVEVCPPDQVVKLDVPAQDILRTPDEQW